jgi:hypothetical protein
MDYAPKLTQHTASVQPLLSDANRIINRFLLHCRYSETATVETDTEALKQHARVLGPGEAPTGKAQVFRYGHTCLKGHFLAGEERFQVEYHPADDSVWYVVVSCRAGRSML